MKAYKFLANVGIEKAKAILDSAPSNAVCYWQIPRCEQGVYSSSEAYEGRSIVLEKLKVAIEDFELVAEYKLPDDFLSKEDEFGLQGTWLYLDHYAFYSNDEEKAVLDRLQLALDRITKGIESSNDQEI